MKHFTKSNYLLGDPPNELRKQLRDDGYLFLRDTLPKEQVLHLRRQILEFRQEAGWLREGSALMDALLVQVGTPLISMKALSGSRLITNLEIC